MLENFITKNSILELKKSIKSLVKISKNTKDYKIYLEMNYINIKCKNKNYNVYIIEIQRVYYWLIKLNNNCYLLILKTINNDIKAILSIIKNKLIISKK